jgi:maleylacetoacetate isomerase
MDNFILYSYFRSSASFRVRIAMNLKAIEHEIKFVHLLKGNQRSSEYRQLNPSAQVPTLLHGGRVLAQSIAIIDYLDSIEIGPKLFAQNDPFRRAVQLQACEIINSGVQPLHNLDVLNELGTRAGWDQTQKDEWTVHWITKGMLAFEELISHHCKKFCFGDEVSAADCFLVPGFVNLQRFKIPESKFPNCDRIFKNCMELEAFQKARPEAQDDYPKAL